MKKIFKGLGWGIERLSVITGVFAAICIFAAAVVVTEGVIIRKVFGLSTIWQIECSVFLLIAACFVGAPFVQKGEHHLNVDLVIIYMSPKVREITLVVVSIISCILCALVAWYAWPMWTEAAVRGDLSASLWSPPLWIPYLFMPFGMSLLFLQYIVNITKKINTIRRGEYAKEVTRSEVKDIEIPGEKK